MIKINLAARKRTQATVAKVQFGAVGNINVQNLGAQLEELRDLPFRKILVPIVIGIAATYGLDNYKDSEVQKLDTQIADLQAEKPKLEAEAAKLAGYEELKKSFEKDELTIRTKVETIRKLIAGRTTTVKMITEVAKTTPEHLWLSSISIGPKEISFKGYSSDFSLISDFMKTLNENAYVKDVTLKDTQMAEDDSHHEVAKFELLAKER